MCLLFGERVPGRWLWPGGRVEIPGKRPPCVGLGQINRPLVVSPEFLFTHKGVCACVLGTGIGQESGAGDGWEERGEGPGEISWRGCRESGQHGNTVQLSPSLCWALGHRMLVGLPRKPNLEAGLWSNQYISCSCGGLDPCWVPEVPQIMQDAREGPHCARAGSGYTWAVGTWSKEAGVRLSSANEDKARGLTG